MKSKIIILFTVILLYIIVNSFVSVACVLIRDGYQGDDCGPLKFKDEKYGILSDAEWQQLKADDLKDKLDKVPDLSKLDQKEFEKETNRKYGINIRIIIILPRSKIEGDTLISGDNTINLKEFKGTHTIDVRDGRLLIDGNEYIVAQNVRSDGKSVTMDSVNSFSSDYAQVLNAKNVRVFSDSVQGDYAGTFIQDGSLASNVYNFNSKPKIFSVEKADSLISSGITVVDIENTEFTVTADKILMAAGNGTTLRITGKGFIEVEFEAFSDDSKITVSKEESLYEIEKGKLNYSTNEYTDAIETNSTAKVEIDESGFGFRCMTVNPVSTYWYFDKDAVKDFGINIPQEGEKYKLCIKRIEGEVYRDYDGLVDFVGKNILLNKIVNYLRHPLKNNQIASLLSAFVYKGLKDISANLYYDNSFIFLNSIFIRNYNDFRKDILAVTYPSNYYTIKEMEVGNEVHSVVFLNLDLKKEDLTQNINYEYETDYFNVKARIINNTLFQEKGGHKLTIYPPGRTRINEISGYAKK